MDYLDANVAPFAGAWIEIASANGWNMDARVAPFAGAWIEILTIQGQTVESIASLPSRERGLKSGTLTFANEDFFVAPFAGAWIEI